MYGFGEYLNSPDKAPRPGTALVEHWGGHSGFGKYVPTQNYSLTPAGQTGIRGMGCLCPGMGGCNCGLGQTGIFGTSLFESSDPSTWGLGEWASIAVGGYIVVSVLFTTRTAARATHRKGKAVGKALKA